MADEVNRAAGGGLAPPFFLRITMKEKKHGFMRCPKCRKKGQLLEEQSFIYYHVCEHNKRKQVRKWSGNSGRLIGEGYTDDDSIW